MKDFKQNKQNKSTRVVAEKIYNQFVKEGSDQQVSERAKLASLDIEKGGERAERSGGGVEERTRMRASV